MKINIIKTGWFSKEECFSFQSDTTTTNDNKDSMHLFHSVTDLHMPRASGACCWMGNYECCLFSPPPKLIVFKLVTLRRVGLHIYYKIKMTSFQALMTLFLKVSTLFHFTSNLFVKNVDLNGSYTHNLKTVSILKMFLWTKKGYGKFWYL